MSQTGADRIGSGKHSLNIAFPAISNIYVAGHSGVSTKLACTRV